jgi:hypothetical protein
MPPLDVRLVAGASTHKVDPSGPEHYVLQIEDPPSSDLEEGLSEFRAFLEENNLFQDIEEQTGIRPDVAEYTLTHRDCADWEGVSRIMVNYSRGERAYLSMAHELVHIILRQNDWTSDPTIAQFILKHPKFSSSRGEGYRLEQMVAYLVQHDLSNMLEKRHGEKRYGEWFPEEKIEALFEREYQEEDNERLGRLIIKMWKDRDPSENIIRFMSRVCEEY